MIKINFQYNILGSCGSCYSFASMAMLESRYRIMTKNLERPVFSPQDVVECSEYSQGEFVSDWFGFCLNFLFSLKDATADFHI